MTSDDVSEAEQALAEHSAFEETPDGYSVTTTPFQAQVRLADAADGVYYQITVRTPTLDAAVASEDVADVVEDGWFETLQRRLADVGGAVRVSPDTPTAEIDRTTDEVVVESGFRTTNPSRGASDAKALVHYVEGTFVEGIIPGYTYRDPVASLRERARSRG